MIKLLVLIQILLASFCFAAAPEQQDRVTLDMVRQRQYAGGRDEEDLSVQTNTTPIVRKLDAKVIQSQVLKGVVKSVETPTEESAE